MNKPKAIFCWSGLSWAVRNNSPELLSALNKWLAQFIKTSEYNFIYNKYYKCPEWTAQRKKTGYLSVNNKRLCAYDEIIKKYSGIVLWDWRLIASLMYQESQFNTDLVSSQGAMGLMQIVPVTAKHFNIDSLSSPTQNIKAGIEHLKELDGFLNKKIKNRSERIKFVLAAYNTGINNVLSARRRAKKFHKNPNLWDDNVEYFIFHDQKLKDLKDPIKKHTLKTYTFVREILERYEYYRTVIKD